MYIMSIVVPMLPHVILVLCGAIRFWAVMRDVNLIMRAQTRRNVESILSSNVVWFVNVHRW
jgi:ribosomal protein L19E